MSRFALLGAIVLGGCMSTEPTDAWRDRLDEPESTRSRPAVWQAAGRSVEGRAIEIQTLGMGPRRVLWIGSIHGNEREGSFATEALPGAFLAYPGLEQRVTMTMIRDLDPDGTAIRRRGNARHVDLNRNFPASNFHPGRDRGFRPLDQPETRFVYELIKNDAPDLVIVCHSSQRGQSFVNYDGPAWPFAARFSRISSYPVVHSNELDSTPGSLGSWLGHDQGIPVLTLEFRRGTDPARAWDETRQAILSTLAMR